MFEGENLAKPAYAFGCNKVQIQDHIDLARVWRNFLDKDYSDFENFPLLIEIGKRNRCIAPTSTQSQYLKQIKCILTYFMFQFLQTKINTWLDLLTYFLKWIIVTKLFNFFLFDQSL